MSATPGTPEWDELDVLATLVDAYEAKHHPIDAPVIQSPPFSSVWSSKGLSVRIWNR
jgi:hypothetical protein